MATAAGAGSAPMSQRGPSGPSPQPAGRTSTPAFLVGQTLGQTASFRQTAPETWCQSRVCGAFLPSAPKTVKHLAFGPWSWTMVQIEYAGDLDFQVQGSSEEHT